MTLPKGNLLFDLLSVITCTSYKTFNRLRTLSFFFVSIKFCPLRLYVYLSLASLCGRQSNETKRSERIHNEGRFMMKQAKHKEQCYALKLSFVQVIGAVLPEGVVHYFGSVDFIRPAPPPPTYTIYTQAPIRINYSQLSIWCSCSSCILCVCMYYHVDKVREAGLALSVRLIANLSEQPLHHAVSLTETPTISSLIFYLSDL